MAILTSNATTFVDLTEQKKLSSYLTSNLPTVQVKDPDTNVLNPDWKTTNLKISPVIYLDQTSLTPGVTVGLSVTWKRKDGSSNETALDTNENVDENGVLTISENNLTTSSSKMITYTCYISYYDSDTLQDINIKTEMSFALIQNASNAKTASIDGEQVFKYDENSTLVGPSQILLTANVQGVNISNWQYKNSSGSFVDYPTTSDNSSITNKTLIVKPTHDVFNNNTATIKLVTDDTNVCDYITITKIYDGIQGQPGVGGLTVILCNEAETIPCNPSSDIASATVANTVDVKIPFVGYKGINKIPVKVSVDTLPSGVTVKTNTASTSDDDGILVLTFEADSNLSGTANGTITINCLIDNQSIQMIFSWSKSVKGDNGEDSIIFSLYTPNGNVIQNGNGSVFIKSIAYEGTTTITSGATYVWRKYVNGKWTTISNATGSAYTVQASDILNIASFECIMTYKSKTYRAVATVMDKTDPCVSEMLSMAGNTFKNGLGATAVYVLVRRAGEEIDPLKGKISSVAPENPVENTFWWKVDEANSTCTLMKYSEGAWTKATSVSDQQELTYTWYKRGKTGEEELFEKTGKVIYFTANEVDSIATLQCEVSDNQ